MRRVHLSAKARLDLLDILEYIAKDSSRSALRVVADLEAACFRLANGAHQYALLRGLEDLSLRQYLQAHYRIVFRLDGDTVEIVRVLHGARDYEAILDDGD